MDNMIEGVIVHERPDGSFDAEVVVDRKVVWRRPGYRSREEAKAEADQELAAIRRRR